MSPDSGCATSPLVGYHIQRGELFFGDDRHGPDETLWLPFSDPFVCRWWELHNVQKFLKLGDIIRVSLDGVLV